MPKNTFECGKMRCFQINCVEEECKNWENSGYPVQASRQFDKKFLVNGIDYRSLINGVPQSISELD